MTSRKRLCRMGFRVVAAAVVATAFAYPAMADHRSPFLGDLEEGLAALEAAPISITTTPHRYQTEKRALGRALGVLERSSSTLTGDLALLARVTGPLERTFGIGSDDPSLKVQALLTHTLNQFRQSMLGREYQLRFRPRGLVSGEAYRAGHEAMGRYMGIAGQVVREGTSLSKSARLLSRASRYLRVAGVRLGLGSEPSYVTGTLTATVDGTPRTWSICTAYEERFPGPTSTLDQFSLFAFSADPDAAFEADVDLLAPPGPDGPEGGMTLYADPTFPELQTPGISVKYNPSFSDLDNRFVLTAHDAAAGTATGTFRMTMTPTDGSADVLVVGEFEITSGFFGAGF